MNDNISANQLAASLPVINPVTARHGAVVYAAPERRAANDGARVAASRADRPVAPASLSAAPATARVTVRPAVRNAARSAVEEEPELVQASMSQVEMTIWLCIMAIMATGMLALLAMVSQ